MLINNHLLKMKIDLKKNNYQKLMNKIKIIDIEKQLHY